MKGLIAVDIGTTSLRAIVFDDQGRRLHTEQQANPPTYLDDGGVEQDPHSWSRALLAALRGCSAALASRGGVAGCLSVTAQRSSVIAVDAQGEPLHPALMWQDTRSGGMARAMADAEGEVYRRSGLRISPVFSAVKMRWLKRHRPQVWAAAHKLIGVQDWVLHRLTGRYVTDRSLASRTNLLDLDTGDWSDELLRLFEVPRERLCELVDPGAVVGGLRPEVAAATGLPAGLPVVSAGGDQQCAALGMGLFAPGRAVANTGTGSYLIGHVDRPVRDAAMRVSCNVSAVPGAYIVEAAMLSTGSVAQWFAALMAGDPTRPGASLQDLVLEAAQAPAGAHGVLMLPHFRGCGTPHWDPAARGAFVNLSLSTTRGDMARAIIEAIAVELAESLALIESMCGVVGEVSVSGGLTRSELFNRIQCDMLERPLRQVDGSEATAQGAWVAGCVAAGWVGSHAEAVACLERQVPAQRHQPDPAQRPACRALRQRARAVYDALASPALRELFKDQEPSR